MKQRPTKMTHRGVSQSETEGCLVALTWSLAQAEA